VGRNKGRLGQGFALGFCLSIIGLLIIAVLPDTEIARGEKHKKLAEELGLIPDSTSPKIRSRESFRQQAMKDVLSDHTELLNDDSESLKRLSELTEKRIDQLHLIHQREIAKQEIRNEEEKQNKFIQSAQEQERLEKRNRQDQAAKQFARDLKKKRELEKSERYGEIWKPLKGLYMHRIAIASASSAVILFFSWAIPTRLENLRQENIAAQYAANVAAAAASRDAQAALEANFYTCKNAVDNFSSILDSNRNPNQFIFISIDGISTVKSDFQNAMQQSTQTLGSLKMSDGFAATLSSVKLAGISYLDLAARLSRKIENSSWQKKLEQAWDEYNNYLPQWNGDSDDPEMKKILATQRKTTAKITLQIISWLANSADYVNAQKNYEKVQGGYNELYSGCETLKP
jgi:hypothetical protein